MINSPNGLLRVLVTAFLCLSISTFATPASALQPRHATTDSQDGLIANTQAARSRYQKASANVQAISCGQEIPFSDENGTWQLRFQCFPKYGVVNWHYNIAPKVQAIAVSLATEDGLRWWRNGIEQPRNSEHIVPVDYTFHGTMNRVHVGDVLDYQDYITFRHNLGSGGTASVTFAGSIQLVY